MTERVVPSGSKVNVHPNYLSSRLHFFEAGDFAFYHVPDPDMADQGQVLVVVTASVGGFSLLVILTLFLLITGR